MAKSKKRKPAKALMLVVASKVRAWCKDEGCRIGADAMATLSDKVVELLGAACGAARADRRQTIKDRDIVAAALDAPRD